VPGQIVVFYRVLLDAAVDRSVRALAVAVVAIVVGAGVTVIALGGRPAAHPLLAVALLADVVVAVVRYELALPLQRAVAVVVHDGLETVAHRRRRAARLGSLGVAVNADRVDDVGTLARLLAKVIRARVTILALPAVLAAIRGVLAGAGVGVALLILPTHTRIILAHVRLPVAAVLGAEIPIATVGIGRALDTPSVRATVQTLRAQAVLRVVVVVRRGSILNTRVDGAGDAVVRVERRMLTPVERVTNVSGAGVAVVALVAGHAATVDEIELAAHAFRAKIAGADVVIIALHLRLHAAVFHVAHRDSAGERIVRAVARVCDVLALPVAVAAVVSAGDAVIAILQRLFAVTGDALCDHARARRLTVAVATSTALDDRVCTPDTRDAHIDGRDITVLARNRHELTAATTRDADRAVAIVHASGTGVGVRLAVVAADTRDAAVLRADVAVAAAARLVRTTPVRDLIGIARIVRARIPIVTREVVGRMHATSAVAAVLRARDTVIAVILGSGRGALVRLHRHGVDERRGVHAHRVGLRDRVRGRVGRLHGVLLDRRGRAGIAAGDADEKSNSQVAHVFLR